MSASPPCVYTVNCTHFLLIKDCNPIAVLICQPFNLENKLLEEAGTLFDMTLSKSSSPLLITLTRFLYLRGDVSKLVTFNSNPNSDILTPRCDES